ncbi:MAG: ATP-dependent RecD-like DNA helicase [Anaerolineae bacterium]|nr:ATP-dependent RecD-like DNA helicase [Anaerolineae bacterium]
MAETVKGTVERITYYNEENGYSVLRVKPEQLRLGTSRDGLLTVVGALPELQPGEAVEFTGEWVEDARYGQQFKAESVKQTVPATVEGMRRYLGSGLIRGIGPRTAEKIVDHFGLETLNVLDHEPARLLDVPDVGRKRMQMIARAWAEQQAVKEVMLFLQGHQIATGLAIKIYKQYGDDSIRAVKENPYRLARDIWGIGFLTADKIARDLGLAEDSPHRMEAGAIYALNEATNDGHVFVPREELITTAAELLRLEAAADGIEAAIDRLHAAGEVEIDHVPSGDTGIEWEAIYLPAMYYSETGATKRLRRMLETPASRLSDMQHVRWVPFLASLLADSPIVLTEQQRGAIQQALTSKVSILTGGPGTGKTTTLRTVIAALIQSGHRFTLCSPTGRAAKRLAEATGQPAQTIHRLLGYSPAEGFAFNEERTLDTDMIVVDEASMIDLSLFYNLLKAIAPDTHLLLVGDVDQLPSVGAGDVLRDLIRSESLPVTRLAAIFRQEGGSLIIRNAHQINAGQQPDTRNEGEDFFFFGEEEPAAAASLVVDIVQNRIPTRFGLDPLQDVQVLVPMYRGPVGVDALNSALQAALNPPGRMAERRIMGRLFRAGDKVMQLRNNYEKEVFNGDIGRVKAFDFEEQTLLVDMDGRTVAYEFSEVDELTHAYAISVHKSQGSEYPVVVVPVLTQHYMMLQRNLLYTAITRARQIVVLVGTRKAIAIAVRNDQIARRYSALDWRVRQGS